MNKTYNYIRMVLFAKTHRAINNWLTIVVVALGLYITITPWSPRISLWIDQKFDDSSGYVYRGSLSTNKIENSKLKPPPEDNRLVIPAININEPIVEGQSLLVIGNGGTWRRPNTSTPDQGGNTVIVGHRFTYSGVSTFYNLDMLSPGDKFSVWWNKTEYVYEVFESLIVPPTASNIESNSSNPMVTLYTCTPIWTAKNRLVVKAKLIDFSDPGESI